MRIKDTVYGLLKTHGTNDPFCIAERRNILIFHRPLGNILGFYTSSRRIQMIYLNTDLSGTFRRFVCAHELGHSILHAHINTPFLRQHTLFSVDKVEKEANAFAVELILSDESLDEFRETRITIQEACAIYGIPQALSHLKQQDAYRYPSIFTY